MADFKFLHAADVHLGRPFSGLERSSPHLADLFRRAGQVAWERIVETAIARKVDAVTLAGDIFDSSNPSVRARVVFREGIQRLYEEGIPVFLAAGNHDPLSTFSDSLKNLPGLHLFGPEPEKGGDASGEITQGVLTYGAGFPKADTRENLARRFRRDSGSELAIGVLHTNVSGSTGHRNYAPCTLDDLTATGMDVWCLGHVHSAAILRDYPLILYPGASQGARLDESGPRGCYLVTVTGGNEIAAEFLPVAPVRWEALHLEVSSDSGGEELVSLAESACADLCSDDESLEAVVVALNVTGRPRASSDREEDVIPLLAERLERLPVPVFLGPVHDLTCRQVNLESLESEEGFLGDFLRLWRSTAQDKDALRELTAGVRGELLRKIGRSPVGGTALAGMLSSDTMLSESLLDETAELVGELFFDPDRG
jgi:DNA repair protein SbcD/Mre11